MMDQKGQSLVGVIVASGILSILLLAMTNITVAMTKNNNEAMANSDILAYVNQIRVNILSPDRATTMLAGNHIDNTVPMIVNDPVVPNKILAQPGLTTKPNSVWNVKDVIFDQVILTNTPGLYRLTLSLVFQKDSTRIIGPSVVKRTVCDVYCFVSSGLVTTCTGGSDPTANAKLECLALGYVWTDANPFGTQCVRPQPTPVPSPTTTPSQYQDDSNRDDDHHDQPCNH